MGLSRDRLRLYLVTDPALCPGPDLIRQVRAAVAGGVTMVQLRDKHATTAGRTQAARALHAALSGTGVPLIVNDDLEAAIASGAEGAHIGQDDIDPATARARLGPDRILGLSCETEAAVRAANEVPVDYLGLGPVFATATKPDHKTPLGPEGLARLVAVSRHPNVAIGGLGPDHAGAVLRAGADGLAVVSAICGRPDPRAAARAFLTDGKGGLT